MDILKLKFVLRCINVRILDYRISAKSYNEYKSKEFSTGINFHLYNNNCNNFTLDTFLLQVIYWELKRQKLKKKNH